MRKYRTYNLLGDFGSGVLSPAGQDNVNKEEWLSGAAEMRNFDILRDGGIRGRRALQCVGRLSARAAPTSAVTGGMEGTVVADRPSEDGIHTIEPEDAIGEGELTAAQASLTRPFRYRVALDPSLALDSVTFHNCRMRQGTWHYQSPTDSRVLTFGAQILRAGETIWEWLEGRDNVENGDPYLRGAFAAGLIARDIVLTLPRPPVPRLQGIRLAMRATEAFKQSTESNPAINLQIDGVSCISTREGGKSIVFTRPPYRILSWVLRELPLIVTLTLRSVQVSFVRPSGTLQPLSFVRWGFTPKQLRELTWTNFGDDLMLFHRDFTRPLRLRMVSETQLAVDRYELENLPVTSAATQSILDDSDLSITVRDDTLTLSRGGAGRLLITPALPGGLTLTPQEGAIVATWNDSAIIYYVWWMPTAEYNARQTLGLTDADLWNDARRVSTDASTKSYEREARIPRYRMTAATLVVGTEYTVGIGIELAGAIVYPGPGQIATATAQHPAPGQVENLRATSGPFPAGSEIQGYEFVTLGWDAVPNAEQYQVERREQGRPASIVLTLPATRPGAMPGDPPLPIETTQGLGGSAGLVARLALVARENRETFFRMRALRAQAPPGRWSNLDSITLGTAALGVPTSVTATASTIRNDQATLRWVQSRPRGLVRFDLGYKKATDAVWTGTQALTASRAHLFTGLDRNTLYDFRIRNVRASLTPGGTPVESDWAFTQGMTELLPLTLQQHSAVPDRFVPPGFFGYFGLETEPNPSVGDMGIPEVYRPHQIWSRLVWLHPDGGDWPTEDELSAIGNLGVIAIASTLPGGTANETFRDRAIFAADRSNRFAVTFRRRRGSFPVQYYDSMPTRARAFGTDLHTNFNPGAGLPQWVAGVNVRVRMRSEVDMLLASDYAATQSTAGDLDRTWGGTYQAAGPWTEERAVTLGGTDGTEPGGEFRG